MKLIQRLTLLFFLVWITGCGSTKEENEESYHTRVPVTVTKIESGTMTDAEDVIAYSSYLHKAVIKSPVSGYLENVKVTSGDQVTKNELIFNLKTKEASALTYDSTNPLSFKGMIPITSSTEGQIISVDHSKGDYVMEGDQLCSIALPRSLAFIVEVPYELIRYIVEGHTYTIELPDGKKLDAVVNSRLPGATTNSQTQRFILQPKQNINLPENLLVKVNVVKNEINNAIFLPKSCILSDEIMKHFWVMKVVNDSLSVRVNITIGMTQEDKIQIIQPVFSPSDLILSSGNYGLGDSAFILITNRNK